MSDQILRLSKLMAQKGLCSRREADVYIEKGLVYVDGEVVSQLGTKVHPQATIELKGEANRAQNNKLTILLNKPLGVVSNLPEKGYTAAIDLITPESRDTSFKTDKRLPSYLPKIAVAGRLDINSKGLLVLTQDGRVAKQLIGRESKIEKEYLVRVDSDVTEEQLRLLRHGLSLDDEPLRPAKVKCLDSQFLSFILNQGKKRQIRRMCELVNLEVLSIKRVRIGKVRLGSLKVGQWRFLEADESF